jgi:hypothetical protein
MRDILGRLPVLAVAVLLAVATARLVKDRREIARLPVPVLRAVEARFPHAYKSHVEAHTRGGRTVYDLFVRQDGEAYVVSVCPDGVLLRVAHAGGLGAAGQVAPAQ